MTCKLCDINLKRLVYTKVYFESENLLVLDCEKCKEAMVVSKLHKPEFFDEDMELIKYLSKEKFKDMIMDTRRNSCKDHAHLHFREAT